MMKSITGAVEILRMTPDVLRAWLSDLSDEWIHCNTGPETFSPYDVVGHLIHGERTDWMVRLRIILEQGTSTPFEPFDRFAMHEASKGKSLSVLIDDFAKLRDANLTGLLALNLSRSDLEKEGVHPEFGRVTLSQLIATWAVHDLNHIGQIARTMAFQYRSDVGPWKKYLAILSER